MFLARATFAAVTLLTALNVSAAAGALMGHPSVVDGDTNEVHGVRIRLYGIDAPEARQLCQDAAGHDYRCGQKAALALADHIDGGTVSCDQRDVDRYGRRSPSVSWARRI